MPVAHINHNNIKNVAIVGAGISGLNLASYYQTHHPEIQVDVYETMPYAGGCLKSIPFKINDLQVQEIDISNFMVPNLYHNLKSLMENHKTAIAKTPYQIKIYDNAQFITKIAINNLKFELFKQSVTHLPRWQYKYLYNPMFEAIFNLDLREIPYQSILKILPTLIISPDPLHLIHQQANIYQSIIKPIYENLQRAKTINFHFNHLIKDLQTLQDQHDLVICTTPPHRLSKIINDVITDGGTAIIGEYA